ncbi:type II toxin-antitoxin system VapC family toxin [Rarobacter faecitabidus]|uniref:Ribonuclease VapC n=1 Tax=Rarobacter faecitabidus TaxID=13243 RepID=A0A542ZNX9_RARFA|nr:type II toxin-antitoxin system VapC family toxin [Rarobacter faecitabidus]TQL62055.1 hypothetical protein FB461_1688 [Rarobacter faecitabidus]
MIVDTDILIAHLRGVDAARDWFTSVSPAQSLRVSAVSVAELTGGMRPKEVAITNRLLGIFDIVPVDEPIARLAGELRRMWHGAHSGISLGDYLIAATCQWHGEDLATINVKHYPMIDDLRAAFRLPRG